MLPTFDAFFTTFVGSAEDSFYQGRSLQLERPTERDLGSGLGEVDGLTPAPREGEVGAADAV